MRKDTQIVNLGRGAALLLGLAGAMTAHAGSLSFASQQAFAAGTDPSFVTNADLNGDGKTDLIVADGNDNAVVVLLNTTPAGAATASYAVQQSFGVDDYTWSIAVADVNGDGKPDLIVTYLDDMGVVSVLLNNTPVGSSTVSFAAPVDFAIGSGMFAWVAAGDLDGDGKPDIVVTNNDDGTLSVLTNTTPVGAGIPSFASQMVLPGGDAPRTVTIADLDGDGHPDIIVAAQADDGVAVLTNSTSGGVLAFNDPQTLYLGFVPYLVVASDLNGDGLDDLAVTRADGNEIAVFMNTASGSGLSFADPQVINTAYIAQGLTIADLDGDGKPDLVAAYYTASTVDVFSNTTATGDTQASFAAPLNLATGDAPYGVTSADVNGDGLIDLVTVNFNDSTVGVALNTTSQSQSMLVNGGSAQSSSTCKLSGQTAKHVTPGKMVKGSCQIKSKKPVKVIVSKD